MADEEKSDRKGVLDELDDIKDRAAAKAATAAAKRTVSKLANELLDDLEKFLLGHKGAAEEILKKEAGVEALDRVRDAYGVDDPDEDEDEDGESDAAKVRRERRERALAQLQELKRLRDEEGEGPDPPPSPPSGDDEPAQTLTEAKVRRRL